MLFASQPRRRDRRRPEARRRSAHLRPVERLEERSLLSTMWVTSVDDSGPGSLRQAIADVNNDTSNPAADSIDFAIPGAGVHTIRPLSNLPNVTHAVLIDGYSQPGSSPNTLAVGDNAALMIELDGSQAGPSGSLHLMAANTTVRGLDIHDFHFTGVWLDGQGGETVQGCFIGTDPTGETALTDNLYLTSGGNLVGANGDGLNDFAERNVVATTGLFGYTNGNIVIAGNNNVVAGNYVGTDATGTRALSGPPGASNLFGVFVSQSSSNRIGASGHDVDAAAEGNVISGNLGGVLLEGGGQNVVAGNLIGTDASGTLPLGNGNGTGSNGIGIGVTISSSNGNLIGTDGDGVGDALERNVISGNSFDGIDLTSSNNNVVAGNYIGTDVTGTKPLGNYRAGINLNYGSSSNRIGTDGQSVDNVGERNIISSNILGIELGSGAPGQGNHIAGNWIGVGSDGGPLGNGFSEYPGGPSGGIGIYIEGDSSDQIGGSPALANVIANTFSGSGVVIEGNSIGDSVRANMIYNNRAPIGGLAIDLGRDGVTPNNSHPGQAGPNNWQNDPVLSTAVAGSSSRVIGTLNSTPNTTFILDFYANDPDKGSGAANGEGQYYLGSATATTDASGNVGFNVAGLSGTTPGEWVSATATDPGGNTSEMALDVQVVKVATTTTLAASVTAPLAGVDTVSLTAAVSGTIPGAGAPSGSVDFFDATTNTDLGAASLSAGAAVLNTSFVVLGGHTIVATYSGDGSFVTSSSTTTINVIPPASLSGVVFADFNDDGQVDFGEKGIAGVPITLTGTDDLGRAVNLSQPTDGAGAYVFERLRPGTYTITETQPTGYTQGINTVGTAGGTVSGDTFSVGLAAGVNALNDNYGERPAASGRIQEGQTAEIGFWNNRRGQALIKALNGGAGTQLGDWLAVTFPHMFGRYAASDNLAGKSNADVAAFFQGEFVAHRERLDAQVMATALSVYVTDATLDDTGVGRQYGFIVAGNGLATSTYNVGANGAAFGAADNTVMTVMDILLAADSQAVNGALYNGDKTKRDKANNVFSAINEAGSIG